MSTMKDIAKRAGISVATVSCALSGAKPVSQSTMRKIWAAIDELDYIPNAAARSLKLKVSNEIGVVLPDIDDSFHADILKGISVRMQREGYYLNFAFSQGVGDYEQDKIDKLLSKKIGGLLVLTCQSGNTEYFRKLIEIYRIPIVFIERKPLGIDANFIGFDNQRAMYHMTKSLIERGYQWLSLVCGPLNLSCEAESARGFERAASEVDGVQRMIYQTSMTMEDAFKVTMCGFESLLPQAVLTTSTTIAKGAMETLRIYGKSIPDDVCVVSLGEESWNRSNQLYPLFSTDRSAITLGSEAASLLIKNMQSPLLFEPQTIVMEDSIGLPDLPRRKRPSAISTRPTPEKRIKLLTIDMNTQKALRVLSRDFTNKTGIAVDIASVETTGDIFRTINEESRAGVSLYDVYMFDVPWISYIGSRRLLMDITEFVHDSSISVDRFLSHNIEHCIHEGRYYGVPIVGGSQLLLYRKDLFDDTYIRREFEKQYKIALRPPRTWTEFNGICRFFTQAYNSDSPVPYGTSFSAGSPEEAICFILPYLWAYQGGIYDQKGLPMIDTPENARALRCLLSTLMYSEEQYLTNTLQDSTALFANGKIAMLLNFSEYVSELSHNFELLRRTDFAALPGKISVSIGWNLGVSRFTKNQEWIFPFLNWVCERDTSYYLTILDGQTTVKAPYENNELKRLYPWLDLSRYNLQYCRKRQPPSPQGKRSALPRQVEAEMVRAFYRICSGEADIEMALQEGQERLRIDNLNDG